MQSRDSHSALYLLCYRTTRPNNSVYVLWGPENMIFPGLFPRVSRHREI
jgi:hypothetical protein